MAIQQIGSTYFLGDAQYGTFNVSYPNVSYLEGFLHSGISAELTALCTDSGLSFRNVLPQSDFDAYLAKVFLSFGANGDIDDRYFFGTNGYTTQNNSNHPVPMFNNNGYTLTNNNFSSTNRISWSSNWLGNSYGMRLDTVNIGTTASNIFWLGSANSNALALVNYQYKFNVNSYVVNFWYAGLLDNPNTDFAYYSANNMTKSLTMAGQYDSSTAVYQNLNGNHFIASARKDLLKTGFAEYALNGSSSQWSGDFLPHDNNVTLDYPTIGEASLLRVLEGSYTIGKPAKVTGDTAGRAWLPVGQWTANRVLAMEVYSS